MVARAPLQNALMFRSDPLQLLSGFAGDGKKISCIDLPPRSRVHLVNDPDLVAELLLEKSKKLHKHLFPGVPEVFGNGLVNSSGETHKCVRQAVQPAFYRARIDSWTEAVRATIEELLEDSIVEEEIDVKPLFERMTLVLVGQLLFALDLRAVAGDFFDCVEQMQQLFQQIDGSSVAAAHFAQASQKLDQLLKAVLAEQPRARSKGTLFRLLDADASLDEERTLQEVRNFLMAGSMTTSLLLGTACWLLAAHPQEQILGTRNDGNSHLHHVVNETLRLYPPVWLLARAAAEPFELDGTTFPHGSIFLVCPWTLHRADLFFPEPERFVPNRWAETLNLPRGAYIPFSLGTRNCVGERLGRLVAEQTLAHLLHRFRIVPAERSVAMNLQPRITLWPSCGIWVKFFRHHAL